MSGSTNASRRLDYSYGPVPTWLRRDVESGLLSNGDHSLIGYLYERADTSALIQRRETPRLTLEAIAKAIRWTGELPSLGRHLRRLRCRNRWFTFRVEGNSRTRQMYVFTLYPDGPPNVSDRRPPVPDAARPSVASPEPQAENEAVTDETNETSDRPEADQAGSCPPVDSSCPSVQEAANPLPDSDPPDAADGACPSASDVPEKNKPLYEGTDVGEGTQAHTRKPPADLDEEALALVAEIAGARYIDGDTIALRAEREIGGRRV